jgi:hypothetical protein
MEKEICKTCRFFEPTEEGTTYQKGECRIGSPHPAYNWPKLTHYNDRDIVPWCGEWEEKEEEDGGE